MPKLQDIQLFLNVSSESGSSIEIVEALPVSDSKFSSGSIGWCSDNNKHLLQSLTSGNVIVSQAVFDEMNAELTDLVLLPSDNPRRAFLKVLQQFFVDKPVYGLIHSSAFIDDTVQINRQEVLIGPNVVIERGSTIGKRVTIGANTVIKSNTIISDDCSIGSNCTIGGVGFGYEMNEEGAYELMPHIGNVVLEKRVEIGNNVCIDRAVMGSTLLQEDVKVDNLVHIAHGVEIGKNSLVIAHAMIAGSVKIGKNVWVSPSSSIRQKLSVEDNALVGMGSVVVKNVKAGTIVAGNPAKEFEKK